jgi:tRNA pseudouridine55 synthase
MHTIHGVFNINKPQGMTSHDVVAHVRRLVRGHRPATSMNGWNAGPARQMVRVGHAGTLDPIATGVLPVLVGKATRLVEYLSEADKAYRATLVLGATSDTYDREGIITPTTPAPPMPSLEQVKDVATKFIGQIEQLPPMYSAVKVGGRKLYELARAGAYVERTPRRVRISRLDIQAYRPPFVQIYVECSKGTYIRTLAHDIGQVLGTGAYLSELVRTRHGPFTLEQAVTLQDLEAAFHEGTWPEMLYPPEYILKGWPTYVLTPEQAREVSHGRPLALPPPEPDEEGGPALLAATTPRGQLSAILYWDDHRKVWQPRKVFDPSA